MPPTVPTIARPVAPDLTPTPFASPGLFFALELTLAERADTYVDMSGWTKGLVWVNGHPLGRYWNLGPQQRLYCPAPFLRKGFNRVVVFDAHQTQPAPLALARTLT